MKIYDLQTKIYKKIFKNLQLRVHQKLMVQINRHKFIKIYKSLMSIYEVNLQKLFGQMCKPNGSTQNLIKFEEKFKEEAAMIVDDEEALIDAEI